MMKAEQDYGVEVIVAFMQHQVGRVIYPSGIYRDRLVQQGLVKRLTGPKPAVVETEESKPSIDMLRQRKQPRLTRGA